MNKKRIATAYDEIAQYYDQYQAGNEIDLLGDLLKDIIKEKIEEEKEIDPNYQMKVANLGCGTGTFCILLAEKGIKTISFDYSSKMIEIAKEKAKAKKLDHMTTFYCEDFRNNLEKAKGVDVCICLMDTVNHLTKEEVVQFFKNSFDNLKTRGRLIFDVITDEYMQSCFEDELYYDIKDEYTLMWWNEYSAKEGTNEAHVTLFKQDKDLGEDVYRKSEVVIKETTFPIGWITSNLDMVGFASVDIHNTDQSGRYMITAYKD